MEKRKLRIGVLAVQGAFIEHEQVLKNLGADVFEIRQLRDLDRPMDGLVLPGGESTVQGKLLRDLGLFEPLQKKIREGLPVLATCAGLILLAEKLSNDSATYFSTLPVTVERNAYGRQLGSFFVQNDLKHVGNVPMTFIRAPIIDHVSDGVDVLARVNSPVNGDKIVAVQYKKQLALAFHPELDLDSKVHQYFLQMI
ncbi:MAG: pyridoxal 5'-phosphate synthase glutaminase subunit PdxT [Fibrobacter sp.]|nr:pyridoxal 5'-phosphate synthase glutaminase subunit PdxT [Fibrobacter sp.]